MLKDDAVPHIFHWSAAQNMASRNRATAAKRREERRTTLRQQADRACVTVAVEEVVAAPGPSEMCHKSGCKNLTACRAYS